MSGSGLDNNGDELAAPESSRSSLGSDGDELAAPKTMRKSLWTTTKTTIELEDDGNDLIYDAEVL